MSTNVSGTASSWIEGEAVPIGSGLSLNGTGAINNGLVDANAGGLNTHLGDPSLYPADLAFVNAYGCAILLLPPGETPDDSKHYTENVIGFPYTGGTDPVSVTFSNYELIAACAVGNSGPWVLWYRVNDSNPTDNSGSWTITATPITPVKTMQFQFSTGKYLVSLPLPLPTVTRRTKGAASGATQPLSNLLDESVSTVVDLACVDGTNYQYLSLDFAAAVDLGRISVYNVSLTGAGTGLACYVHSALITNGDFTAATAVPATITPGAGQRDWEFAPASGTVTKRYLYLVPTGGATACTIGDVDVRSTEFNVAAMQNISANISFQVKELRGPASESQFPIENAMYDGAIEVQPEFNDLNEQGIVTFTGAQIAVISTNHEITAGTTGKPLPFVGELISQTTDGRKVRMITYHTFAPGFDWSKKRDDFASSKLTARCRVPDASAANASRVWRIIIGQ